MTINLITFSATLHKNADAAAGHEEILNELRKYYTINLVDHKNIGTLSQDDFSLVFIATGGVERMVMKAFESLPRPILILADGNRNSLAASLEVSAWLRSRGIKVEILHGKPQSIIKRINLLSSNFRAQRALVGARIGVMGTPASWLIASNVDYLLAKRRWGVEFIDIPLERIYDIFDKITDDEVGEACADFAAGATNIKEGSPEEILKAMRLYRAIKQICKEENLQAITLSCFRLIERTGSTGCLALSLLNNDGILAGCEGDLQSIFTMLVIKALTGQAGFMANPSLVNIHNNEIILAHCTIGTKQTNQYIIRNHFETNMGIAIQGLLPISEVTVVKCGGESLDEYYLTSGFLNENTNYVDMCRTQVRIRLDSPADYFLKSPLGNHHIMIQGNHVDVINEFLQANTCKRIESSVKQS
ncbi:fucose isomerase [Bacteroides sp. OttesenSCG-928-E20]|nr:fucose isomerase [Bacteroides sp. OttesenSCG-928-N06]MDL2299485.1 fucose isomerase [Bacteroides sp. OttesenSCG-928-E20]MDL2305208.1 fucose isomerase [Bacteroides sp. OttesenSCG-928-D19]